MTLDLTSLTKATDALEAVLSKALDEQLMGSLDDIIRHAIRSGVIQHFEFTYELCWKTMKRWLEENLGSTYVDGVTRRELFRYAAESRLIEDVDLWMTFHRSRNMTSHTYDISVADDVFESASRFASEARELLSVIQSRESHV